MLAVLPLPGRFEESRQSFHDLGAVAFAFGGGNLSLQAPNRVLPGGSQGLLYLFAKRA
jgi:hypothetical protein